MIILLKNLIIQAVKFIGVSGIGWILDFFIYTCLGLVSENLILNNTISSWVGVTFVFIFATRKIFKNKSRISLKWKYLIYIVYQIILIFLISKFLDLINIFIINNIDLQVIKDFSPILSKIIVTPITMILNFIVMKNIVEKL